MNHLFKPTKAFTILFLLVHQSLNSQVPYSSPTHDQIVQGPCYIFAVVAALESKAIEDFPDADFYEWNLYSTDVLGSRTGNGDIMVQKVIQHAKDYGVYGRNEAFKPASTADLPNINDPLVKGIADFDFCSVKTQYYRLSGTEGNCYDDQNKRFVVESFTDYKYTYSSGDIGWVKDTTPNILEMKGHLNQKRGLIVFIDNYRDGLAHAVFVYGYSGSKWRFKDSWPGDPGNKLEEIPIDKIQRYYYLTGTITSNQPQPQTCQSEITGGNVVSGQTSYMLSPYSSSTIQNVQWSVDGNLSIVSNSQSSVSVKPLYCSDGTGTLSVTFSESGNACSDSRQLTVLGASKQPQGIAVLSPDWSNGQTCPNTVLELEVIDNQNPVYPQTTYNWSISGATLLSGNGTPTVFVRTSSAPWTTFLTFKVRAKYGSCGYSSWSTLYGSTSAPYCGGGALLYAPLETGDLTDQFTTQDKLSYKIISINGKLLDQGKTTRSGSINPPTIQYSGIAIVLVYDDHRVIEKTKIYLNKP